MGAGTLTGLIDTLSGAQVLTVGDVMLDRYVTGRVDRISPEAPIAVLRVENERAMLGGAGNVAANLAALGGGGPFVSALGDDGAGDEVRRLLGALSAISPLLATDSARCTSQKTRFVGGTQQLMRADVESDTPLDADVADEVLALARDHVAQGGAVVLSDYGKGLLTQAVIDGVIAAAHGCGGTGGTTARGCRGRRRGGSGSCGRLPLLDGCVCDRHHGGCAGNALRVGFDAA